MRTNAYQSYFEQEILSADPLKLVVLLYRGALDSVGAARRYLSARDVAGRSRCITKALAIITELNQSLDMRQGGNISAELGKLYDYLQRLLLESNIQQTDAPLAQAEQLLGTLLEGWEQCEQNGNAVNASPRRSQYQDEAEYQSVSYAG